MQDKLYETLEFDKVIKEVNNYTQTQMGSFLVKNLKANDNIDQLKVWQDEIQESLLILSNQDQIPIPNLEDLAGNFKRLERGAGLNGQELASILRLLKVTRSVKSFFKNHEEDEKTYPALEVWVSQLTGRNDLINHLEKSIEDDGRVKSSASSQLASIRRRQAKAESDIRSQLDNFLKNHINHLSDSVITIRNDRYVLPVKIEFRNLVPGTIHDQSASGQTVYVEPQSVVSLNNKRAELQVQERQEIERILFQLSQDLMPYTQELAHNQSILGQLDFIQAKARYAKATNSTKANLNEEGHISLLQARHPLISPDEIVPNDIILGQDYRALIITGPNTGGKTILLKTLGLVQLMGQSGLYIPCESGSQIGVFDQIFAVIGDEQSLEQNLSTFSSHMTNIIYSLENASYKSLLLYDELGSGTDPQEGAALAMAILDYLNELQATVMATTHYPELKLYANEAKSTINASMEFNSETLSPTYRLLIGVPGRSNAIDISRRLGLASDIIENAEQGLGQDSQAINEMITNLEEERRQVEEKEVELDQLISQSKKLHSDLKTEYERFQNWRDDLKEQARKEANEQVQEIKAQAEEVMQEIRDLQMQAKSNTVKEHQLIEQRGELDSLIKATEVKDNKLLRRQKKKQAQSETIEVGDQVQVLDYGQTATVLEINKDEVLVQMGIMKATLKKDQVSLISKKESDTKQKLNIQRNISRNAPTEIDLRGQRYEEAMRRLNNYLDSALLANHPQVTIIHGKGTGVLREGVQKLLKNHPRVTNYEYAPANLGGNGATIAYLE